VDVSPLAVVAVPGSRRLHLFTQAARAAGLPDPVVLPWAELAAGRVRVPPGPWSGLTPPGKTLRQHGCSADSAVLRTSTVWKAARPSTRVCVLR